MAKTIHSEKQKKFRALLRAERKKTGMRQLELAAKMNRYGGFVTKSETGERRVDLVEFLEFSKAIGFDPHAFIDELEDD